MHVFCEQDGHLAVCEEDETDVGGIQVLQVDLEQYILSPAGIDHSASRCWNLVFIVALI